MGGKSPVAASDEQRVALAALAGSRDRGELAQPGEGRFLARARYPMIAPRGVVPDGFDPAPIRG